MWQCQREGDDDEEDDEAAEEEEVEAADAAVRWRLAAG